MEQKKFTPFVSPESNLKELTPRAVLLGVVMAMFMAAANAYLGLKAGMTIAATYTTAVIGMAVIKAFKGTILEENCARTVGSIGGNIASGAIFTLPAFFIAGIWQPFYSTEHYIVSTIMLVVGGILGIMFVTITRRILVENQELPFPESIAAAEIHKAGQSGSGGTGYLFSGMGVGIVATILTKFQVIAEKWEKLFNFGKGNLLASGPAMKAAYIGVGYIIGPRLASINFSGGVLAWGLLAPAIAFALHYNDPVPVTDWAKEIALVWKNYVRYIAVGGMLVGAFYTLYKMRKNLIEGIYRSISTLTGRKGDSQPELIRTDKDINIKWALMTILAIIVVIFFVFNSFANNITAAIVAAIVMVILGFVFAAVSGYLVGVIGVSSNPTSGLTVAVLIAVAFLMVMMGLQGSTGIAAVIGVAAFTCVSVSVAGEMMQDLKAGHILGCTPWRMQLGDIFGVTAAGLVMFFVLSVLHMGDINEVVADKISALKKNNQTTYTYTGNNPNFEKRVYTLEEIEKLAPEKQNEILETNAGFGGKNLAAPQASLMAVVSKSIVEKKTEWILVIVGMFMGLAFIMMQIRSPMLVSVGMYLSIETSFAIFIGGMFKAIVDRQLEKRKVKDEDKEKVSNTGTLLASGLIAGEALTGILFATLSFAKQPIPKIFAQPSYLFSIIGIGLIGFFLVYFSMKKLKSEN